MATIVGADARARETAGYGDYAALDEHLLGTDPWVPSTGPRVPQPIDFAPPVPPSMPPHPSLSRPLPGRLLLPPPEPLDPKRPSGLEVDRRPPRASKGTASFIAPARGTSRAGGAGVAVVALVALLCVAVTIVFAYAG